MHKTLHKIFNETEAEFGISREVVKDIYENFWSNTREFMGSKKLPAILIPKFGKFFPKPFYLSNLLVGNNHYTDENDILYRKTLYRLLKERDRRTNKDSPWEAKTKKLIKDGYAIP